MCFTYWIVRAYYTATDECGNESTFEQILQLVDTTAPVLTIPADYTAECSDDHPWTTASATDNCGEVTIAVVETTDRWCLCWRLTRSPVRLRD